LIMSQRAQIYLLVGLLALAAVIFLRSRSDVPGFPGGVLAADTKFTPLDVQEPNLRLDLLEKIHKTEYAGQHRDIFTGAPMPPKMEPGAVAQAAQRVGPQLPPPPPPVQVPAQFFGYSTRPGGASRVAFFLNGEDVIVVAEGDTFLGNFRLVHIGNDSADVQEISSGRHTQVVLERPPEEAQNP
jgi:hypothetical protein